jgi:DNA polymerase III subunit delta'
MSAQPLPWHAATLSNWLSLNAGHHAWLIVGPAGHGVKELAHAMAAGWLCVSPREGAACGECESCTWWKTQAHPDFRAIAPDEAEEGSDTLTRQEIKVDAIRAFSQWAVSTAHRARKAVVIDAAESMNVQAANALLKMLEEPPSAVRFFLACSDPRKLPATIVSRCLRITAPPASEAAALAWLSAQNAENAQNGPTAQMRDVLAQVGGAPLLAAEHAQDGVQSARRAFLGALSTPASLSALVWGDEIDRVEKVQRRAQLQFRLKWLALWMHDLAVVRAGAAARFNPDYNTELRRLAETLPKVAGFRYYANLIGRLQYIQHPLSARLVLEDALIEYKRLTTVNT